jgi:hypothetical protein
VPRESALIREKVRVHAMVDPVIDGDDEDYDFSEDLKYYAESLTV